MMRIAIKASLKTLLVAGLALASPMIIAQPGSSPPAPRAAAPFDLEGYWISVVNEDWMFRMVTPPKGEYTGVPLNRAGRELADGWDPEADERLGEQCRAYGAPALMRMPGRIRMAWTDDATLSLETEAGEQERTLHFRTPPAAPASRQGDSLARWELAGGSDEPQGNLKVETANLLPGYLRHNGVPYSEHAGLTEYFSVYPAPNGDTWLVVTTEVQDPQYLSQSFITSSHFKKLGESEGSRYWKPAACRSR